LQALLGMARLHDRQGEFAEATRLYERAVQQHPQSATAFNDLGLCFARQQQLDRSIDALTQAIRLKPDRALYRNNIATVLVEQGRLPQAYDHLAAVHPPANAHYNLGFLLSQAAQPAEAVRQFDMALAKDPGLQEAKEWRDVLAGQLAAERSAGPGAAAAEAYRPDAYGSENYGTDPALRAPSTSRPAPRAGTRPEAAAAPETGLQRLPEVTRQQARRPTRDEMAAAPPLPDALENYDLGQPSNAAYRPPSRW
jgi:tetratricopeptide (TPR) repeat protein